ncbi:MAG: sensor histidine kinase, partial [Oscillochloridaceae bacterium umkhey_bin13]
GHTAVVGRVLGSFSGEMEFWWRLGWLVLLAAPYLWYLVMAWYTGTLRQPVGRRWLGLVSVVGLLVLLTLLFGDPLPSYSDVIGHGPARPFGVNGLPAVALIYPIYSITCSLFALAVLRAPASSERFMGEAARRRARPWLTAATWTLLAVGLAVGAAATWLLRQISQGEFPGLTARLLIAVISFDLAVSLLIALAIVLIGQAVVAYEIFTGKSLPRGELRSQWRRALILAAGYGLIVGWSMSGAGIPELPIYQLLLATVLMTVFYALLGWRSFGERERALESLRPFLAGQRLYDRLIGTVPSAQQADEAAPFRALCGELLGAKTAYLIPLGPVATLAGPPLSLPAATDVPLVAATSLGAALPHPPPLCLAIQPEEYGGAIWAIPLLGGQGLIGLLLLGPKRDRGLYTAEEIALAREAGERLVDGQAGAAMARRLVALQRRRLAEDQLLDRRARRLLHDDVLPRLHTAMLELAANPGSRQTTLQQLADVHKQISNLLHDLPPALGPTLERHGPLGALQRALHDECPGAFAQVDWHIPDAAATAARTLEPIQAETLYYAAREAVRNAARHGRGDDPGRSLHLWVGASCDPKQITVRIRDDGVGLAYPSATANAGAGAGLALHSTILAILGGTLSLADAPGGTTVTISLPLSEA